MTRTRPRGRARGVRRPLPCGAAALAAVVVCSAPRPARAQTPPQGPTTPPPPPSRGTGAASDAGAPAAPDAPPQSDEARREAAQQHFDAGVRRAAELRWLEAISELEAARALRATPSVHFDLGQAYRAVGRYRDAIAAYEQFLALVPPDASPLAAQRAQARQFVDELRDAMPSLTVRAAPAFATVAIDGQRVSGGPQRLDPGSHVVALEAPGYRPRTLPVALAARDARVLEVRLEPIDTAARLWVECATPRALIRVDGGAASWGRLDERVTAGRHTVDVTAPGYSPFHRVMVLTPNGSARVRVTLEPGRSVFAGPWFWVGSGLGVAAAVATVVIAVVATAPPPAGGIGGVVMGVHEARP